MQYMLVTSIHCIPDFKIILDNKDLRDTKLRHASHNRCRSFTLEVIKNEINSYLSMTLDNRFRIKTSITSFCLIIMKENRCVFMQVSIARSVH